MPALSLCSSAVHFITPSSHKCTRSAARQQAGGKDCAAGPRRITTGRPGPEEPEQALAGTAVKDLRDARPHRRQRHQIHSREPQEEGCPHHHLHGEERFTMQLPSGMLFACTPGMRYREVGWLGQSMSAQPFKQDTELTCAWVKAWAACALPDSSDRARPAAFRPLVATSADNGATIVYATKKTAVPGANQHTQHHVDTTRTMSRSRANPARDSAGSCQVSSPTKEPAKMLNNCRTALHLQTQQA